MSSIGNKFHQSLEDDECQIVNEEDIILNVKCFIQRLVASIRISGKQAISIESATKEQHQQVAKLGKKQLVKDIHIDTVPDPPTNTNNIRQP